MKHTILFLAANPGDTDRLALDREAHAIQHELEGTGARDRFDFVTRWAVEPLDLLRELRRLKPTVVHYSGHGGHEGLFFQSSTGGEAAQIVTPQALEATFGAAGASVRAVVLNACYSEAHATALLAHIDCVVGTTGPLGDDAARYFAIGFYGALGDRASIAAAHAQGCAAISLGGSSGAARDFKRPNAAPRALSAPLLRVRPGVDASLLILAASR